MKFRSTYKVTAATLAALMLAGCAAIGAGAASEEAEEQRILVPVEAMRIAPQTIRNELIYSGQLAPVHEAVVMPRMQGRVSAVYADVGDRVYEGDILFTMDERDMRNQINQLQAQHSQALSGIANARNTLANVTGGQFETQIMQIDSNMENLEAQLEANDVTFQNSMISYSLALDNYSNVSILFEAGAVPRSLYDQARSSYDQAANALEQVRLGRSQIELSMDQAQRNRDILTDQIARENQDAAAIGVTTAESAANVVAVQLANATDQLADLSVYSPISGVVNVRNVRPHELATMQVPSYVIIDISSLNVEVRVSEIIINHINPGDAVDIIVATHSPYPLQGVVRTVSPGVDHTNTFGVTIEIDNTDETLRPGMFAEVRFVRDAAYNAVVVPVSAVQRNIEGDQYVYILDANNIVTRTRVTTGISNGREIEVISGVSIGNDIIVRGQNYVFDGEEVNVVARS
ncbi:MAG: efflux RND transporter periplasmic adaptor subunit [Defluviitaleaceae bacterium]|nr:efflux RND transporter periplasmic adaptor subunit [Defluviitaleaceae bacterium]